jgi:hypothetical protein
VLAHNQAGPALGHGDLGDHVLDTAATAGRAQYFHVRASWPGSIGWSGSRVGLSPRPGALQRASAM